VTKAATCDTCKHFGPSTEMPAPFGTCGRWKTGYDRPHIEENECLVEDDEWWANVVGPKFGCVLHEDKE
jgi:hypothetical protein